MLLKCAEDVKIDSIRQVSVYIQDQAIYRVLISP